MCNRIEKSSGVVAIFAFIFAFCISCKQSCFDIITGNEVAYWSYCWFPNDPHGIIVEYSKKDSIMRFINDDWTYSWVESMDNIWGRRFKNVKDTLFEYVEIPEEGYLQMLDTFIVVSYSKNKIVMKNKSNECVTWHRLPTKYANKAVDMMNSPGQVTLSTLQKTSFQGDDITNIVDVTWKLYGYGDVSTGMIQKSEALKYGWLNLIKFQKDGTMIGMSTGREFCGLYVISKSNIKFLNFKDNGQKELYDGNKLCDVLPQCKKFRINGNWLQLFYDDGEKYLIFKISNSPKLSSIN